MLPVTSARNVLLSFVPVSVYVVEVA